MFDGIFCKTPKGSLSFEVDFGDGASVCYFHKPTTMQCNTVTTYFN